MTTRLVDFEHCIHAVHRVRPLTLRDVSDVAKRAGVAVVSREGPSWNGKSIRLLKKKALVGMKTRMVVDEVRSPSNLIHEIAHYLVAPPTRRKLVDFGLGTDPEFAGQYEAPSRLTQARGLAEERRASALGILIEYALGANAFKTYREHNWSGGRKYRFNEVCIRLWLRGFITNEGHPRFLVTSRLTKRPAR